MLEWYELHRQVFNFINVCILLLTCPAMCKYPLDEIKSATVNKCTELITFVQVTPILVEKRFNVKYIFIC